LMKFPDFTHGLEKEVAYQVLQNFLELSFEHLSCSFQGFTSDMVDLVFNEYIGKAESRAQVRDGLLDAIGDHVFVFSAIEVARYHRGNATEEENKLSRAVMKYWTNFARNG
ncbi:hypothetical protein CIB84_016562, partial [Bambusicola thoracicus]